MAYLKVDGNFINRRLYYQMGESWQTANRKDGVLSKSFISVEM